MAIVLLATVSSSIANDYDRLAKLAEEQQLADQEKGATGEKT